MGRVKEVSEIGYHGKEVLLVRREIPHFLK